MIEQWKKNERKWKKMKENERTWKKMKENEGKWKNMKENERKWRKMKENEGKWKNEINEKWKKKRKKWRKIMKKTKKNEKMDSPAKSSTISRVYRCCRNFFRQNPRQFPRFCFGMCLFPDENQQPVLGGNRFSEEKWQFSLDVKQKHTFYRRKWTKKIAKVTLSNNNYSFRII